MMNEDNEMSESVMNEQQPVNKLNKWSLIGVAVIAVAVSAAAIIISYNSKQQYNELVLNFEKVQQQRQLLNKAVEMLEVQIKELNDSGLAGKNTLEELKQRVQSSSGEINKLKAADRKDWLVAEAEYLLRLANQRLMLEKDIGGTEALLQVADRAIVEIDDPLLLPVRQSIQNNIAVLKAVPMVNKEDVVLKINAIVLLIDNLDAATRLQLSEQGKVLQGIEDAEVDVSEAEISKESPAENWRTQFGEAFASLSEHIKIHYDYDDAKPLMLPEKEYYLKQNLRLMLEQAQLSMLRGEQMIYENSLNSAKTWLQTYYQLDQPDVTVVIDTLDELVQVQVSPELPDITDSLKALKKVMQEQLVSHTKKPLMNKA